MKSLILGALAVLVGAGWAAAEAPSPLNPYPTPALNGAPPGPVLGPAGVPGGPSMPGLSNAINGYPAAGGSSVYFSADYLLWKIREGAIPPTATTVPVGLISVNVGDVFVDPAGNVIPGLTNAAAAVGFAPVSIVSNTTFGV